MRFKHIYNIYYFPSSSTSNLHTPINIWWKRAFPLIKLTTNHSPPPYYTHPHPNPIHTRPLLQKMPASTSHSPPPYYTHPHPHKQKMLVNTFLSPASKLFPSHPHYREFRQSLPSTTPTSTPIHRGSLANPLHHHLTPIYRGCQQALTISPTPP